MEIPDISIPEIYIPDIPEPYTTHYLTITKPPSIDVPGCTYQHRDIKNTGNRNLLLEDPNGVFTTCDFPFPSFIPLDYTPENMVITEQAPINTDQGEMPETEKPKISKKKDEELVIPPCPSKKDQKIGDFRNDKKLERVIGYERGQNGIDCIILYESVPFVSQYIPSFKQFTGVFSLALVGCSAPIILNLVKPLVKNIIKKLTKKKKDVK